jgi:hypothetical protein
MRPGLRGFVQLSVLFHFAIDRYRNKLVREPILELHNRMAFPSELSPAARLIWILFDGLVLAAVHLELHCLQSLRTGAFDGRGRSFKSDLAFVFHLLRDGLHQWDIEHEWL